MLKFNRILQLVLVFIFFVLPVISLLICDVNLNGFIGDTQCYPDLDILKIISSSFVGIIFLSAFTFFIPILIYILVFSAFIYLCGKINF